MVYNDYGFPGHFREINDLRKSGKLDEAEALARQDVSEVNDKWAWNAFFWVMRAKCMNAFRANEQDKAKAYYEEASEALEHMEDDDVASQNLDRLHTMLMPHYDEVEKAEQLSKNRTDVVSPYLQVKAIYDKGELDESLHETFGWIIYRYLNANYRQLGSIESRRVLVVYMKLKNRRPSMLHSQILNVASHMSEIYPDFRLPDFLRLWDTTNLRDEDYQPSEMPDGQGGTKPVRPLITRIVERCFDMGSSLDEMKNILPDREKFIERTLSSSFYNRIYRISKESGHGNAERKLMGDYMDKVEGVSICNEYHSKILRSVLYSCTDHAELIYSWLPKWGLNNFMDQDWEEEQKDDKKYPSLVQRTVSAYSGACKTLREDYADGFVTLLKEAINRYPEKDFYRRDYAKYLFAKGKKEEAIEEYKRLLCTKNDYYLWKELSEMVEEKTLQRSAVCKGLFSAGKEQEQYIGVLRLKFASILISEKNFSAAQYELDAYLKQKVADGFRISQDYEAIQNHIPQGTVAAKSNRGLYEEGSQAIEEMIYSSLPATMMVVKSLYNNKDGKPKARLISPKGDTVSVNLRKLQRLENKKFNYYYKVTLFKVEDKLKAVMMKPVERDACLSEFPKRLAVVDNINIEKKLFHLVFADGADCVVLFRETPFKPKVGLIVEVTEVRVRNIEKQRIDHNILHIATTEETMDRVKDITGPVRLSFNAKGKRFGFVGDCYIPESMLNGISEGDELSVRSLYWQNKYHALECKRQK